MRFLQEPSLFEGEIDSVPLLVHYPHARVERGVECDVVVMGRSLGRNRTCGFTNDVIGMRGVDRTEDIRYPSEKCAAPFEGLENASELTVEPNWSGRDPC